MCFKNICVVAWLRKVVVSTYLSSFRLNANANRKSIYYSVSAIWTCPQSHLNLNTHSLATTKQGWLCQFIAVCPRKCNSFDLFHFTNYYLSTISKPHNFYRFHYNMHLFNTLRKAVGKCILRYILWLSGRLFIFNHFITARKAFANSLNIF